MPRHEQRLGVIREVCRRGDVVLENPERIGPRLEAGPRPVPVLVRVYLLQHHLARIAVRESTIRHELLSRNRRRSASKLNNLRSQVQYNLLNSNYFTFQLKLSCKRMNQTTTCAKLCRTVMPTEEEVERVLEKVEWRSWKKSERDVENSNENFRSPSEAGQWETFLRHRKELGKFI